MKRMHTKPSRRRAAAVAASIACVAALGTAGPAAAQEGEPYYNEPCSEATLHPEYQNQGNCEDSPPPQPAPERETPLPAGLDVILGDKLGGLL
jgi:hypothetical protein